MALETWAWQQTHSTDEPFPSVSPYPHEEALIADVKTAIGKGTEKTGKAPRILVIGALGREWYDLRIRGILNNYIGCGRGAVDLCLRAGVPSENVLKWDLDETKKGIAMVDD